MARFEFDTTPYGSGGFAKIIKGRDSFLERDIAVKVFQTPSGEFTDDDQERFRREARTLGCVDVCNKISVCQIVLFERINGKSSTLS
jgi:hypothetical protein